MHSRHTSTLCILKRWLWMYTFVHFFYKKEMLFDVQYPSDVDSKKTPQWAPRSERVVPAEKSMVEDGSTPGMEPLRLILGAASAVVERVDAKLPLLVPALCAPRSPWVVPSVKFIVAAGSVPGIEPLLLPLGAAPSAVGKGKVELNERGAGASAASCCIVLEVV